MNARTKDKALRTLDGMAEIVKKERLVKGNYAAQVDAPERKGEVCKGRRYCLLGAAWVAHGARVVYGELEGVQEEEREDYLRRRPALRAVYDALNEAAEARIEKLPPRRRKGVRIWSSPAEGLFEKGDPGRTELLRLIASARRKIRAA